jgi:hypothetical protein
MNYIELHNWHPKIPAVKMKRDPVYADTEPCP